MQKHLFTLLFVAFVLTKSHTIEGSQEFSLDDSEPQAFSFLSLDGEVSSFTLDLFNVTDLFNASAIVDSVQEMVEPIGQGIESVGQQIDAAFAWIGGDGLQDAFQDIVKSIQDPLGEQIDVVWSWVGGEEIKPVKVENVEMTIEVEQSLSADDQYILDASNVIDHENEVTLIEEIDAQYDEKEHSIDEDVEVIMFQEEAVPIPVPIEIPVSVPIEDIDEIMVLIDYSDIAAAMNIQNITSESIESELFNVRFFEVFMGKEIELELKSANLAPVEESKKKSQILSYDAL